MILPAVVALVVMRKGRMLMKDLIIMIDRIKNIITINAKKKNEKK